MREKATHLMQFQEGGPTKARELFDDYLADNDAGFKTSYKKMVPRIKKHIMQRIANGVTVHDQDNHHTNFYLAIIDQAIQDALDTGVAHHIKEYDRIKALLWLKDDRSMPVQVLGIDPGYYRRTLEPFGL